jgi:tRNA (adenine37-N6)-methyltransferase
VKLKGVKGNVITFFEVDILDGTLLLDIKPYVKHFDSRDKVKNGWVKKHFLQSKTSERTRI